MMQDEANLPFPKWGLKSYTERRGSWTAFRKEFKCAIVRDKKKKSILEKEECSIDSVAFSKRQKMKDTDPK